jgi:CheY-like chemotaxis protein
MMPGMTGIEAAIEILAQRPKCRILLFSGHAANADLLSDAEAKGYCFDIIAKPIHPADLLAKLREVGLIELAPLKAQSAPSWLPTSVQLSTPDPRKRAVPNARGSLP